MSNKSFTIIEVTIAVFLITMGTLGVFALIQRTFAFTHIVSSQLSAAYLAQEGVENVRNIRDTNWLEQRVDPDVLWDDGLPIGDWPEETLLTRFQRKITISKPEANILEVSVWVGWRAKGSDHQVTVQTELHNWK